MKGKFVKPTCEVIHFDDKILTVSNCECWDGKTDWGEGADSTCPNLNLPECQCKLNTTDPSLGNCVVL